MYIPCKEANNKAHLCQFLYKNAAVSLLDCTSKTYDYSGI